MVVENGEVVCYIAIDCVGSLCRLVAGSTLHEKAERRRSQENDVSMVHGCLYDITVIELEVRFCRHHFSIGANFRGTATRETH